MCIGPVPKEPLRTSTRYSPSRGLEILLRASLPILLGLFVMVPGSLVIASPTVVDSKFELFVSDPEESIRFYTSLGLEVAQQKPDGYTTLTNGPAVVALSPISKWLPLRWLGFLRRPPIGTEIVLYSDRLEELGAALGAAATPLARSGSGRGGTVIFG